MKKFKSVTAKAKYGWSEWQTPVMTNYHMKCCDCGLVHTLNFRILRVDKTSKKGLRREATILPKDGKFIIQLKARRNKSLTPISGIANN